VLRPKSQRGECYLADRRCCSENFLDNDSLISIDKELIKIAQPDHMIVRGTVDERDIASVAVDQDAVIACEAFPGVEMKGQVNWIGAQAKDGAFADVEVTMDLVDTKGLKLKPNLSCEAFIITGKIPKAIALPAEGVRHGPQGILRSQISLWRLAEISAGRGGRVCPEEPPSSPRNWAWGKPFSFRKKNKMPAILSLKSVSNPTKWETESFPS